MSAASPAGNRIRRAIVVGGGIAGPVTATALAQSDIEATVVETHPEPDEGIGGSLALAPNGVAALDLVGAGDAVRDIAVPISRNFLAVGRRRPIPLPQLDDVEPLRMVQRGRLHDVLRSAAGAAGVVTRYNHRLVNVEQNPAGVSAHFADGSTLEADVLIGADGTNSIVRQLIDPNAPRANYTGLLGFEGLARGVHVDAEVGDMMFAFGREAYYLYWPLPDGTVGWGANLPSKQYLSLTEARAFGRPHWLETLRRSYAADRPGAALSDHTTLENLDVVGGIHIMPPVPHWWRERMVLVGDAVHAPSNSTGQGASLAIESAVELAHCLRGAVDVRAAFATYESRRRGRVEAITRRGAKLNKSKTPGPIGRTVMSVMMPFAMKHMNPEKTFGVEQRYRIA